MHSRPPNCPMATFEDAFASIGRRFDDLRELSSSDRAMLLADALQVSLSRYDGPSALLDERPVTLQCGVKEARAATGFASCKTSPFLAAA